MKLFLERLFYSIKKQSSQWLLALVIAIPVMLLVGLLAMTIFALPTYLLHFVIGDYSVLWIVIVFLAIVVWGYWDELKKWFHWQFIEPFKKEEKDDEFKS